MPRHYINRVALAHLTSEYVNAGTTMYVPPSRRPTVNWDIVKRINLAGTGK